MLRFAKNNGNGIVEINSKSWWAVKIIFTFCVGLAIAAFAWGGRTTVWTTGISRNKSDITELKIENEKQDVRLCDIKDIVSRIDERTKIMKEFIEKIEGRLIK